MRCVWVRALVFGCACAAIGLSGCASRGHVDILSLAPTAIDPPDTTIFHFDTTEANWWKSQSDELVLALRCRRPSPLPFARSSWLKMSFVLQGIPAGNGKNYRVARREVRGLLQSGMQSHRFVSYQGIVGVNLLANGDIKGSFRIWIIHQPGAGLFNLFPQHPSQLLFTGTFRASADSKGIGKALLAETESDGWERSAPATAPASSVTKPP